jgi:hypothetical protein
MTSTPEPPTSRPAIRWSWILVMVLAAAVLGLDLLLIVRKPEPWPRAARLLVPIGLIFLAWNSLLPAARARAKRTLLGLSLVCTMTGLVFAALDYFRP